MRIAQPESHADLGGLEEMLREYLEWDIAQLTALSGIEIDAEYYVRNTLAEIDLYFPPRGRLLMARDGPELVGIGFLKPIRPDACEIKRMYVQPDQRGRGLGRKLLAEMIDAAREIGYTRILLDSACYMTGAHALYRSMGFSNINFYPEGETDEAFKPFMIYMELVL